MIRVRRRKKKMAKKRVYVPLEGQPRCGHDHGGSWGDLPMGREEGIIVVERDGIEYVASVQHGPCSICNKATDGRVKRKITEIALKHEKGDCEEKSAH